MTSCDFMEGYMQDYWLVMTKLQEVTAPGYKTVWHLMSSKINETNEM